MTFDELKTKVMNLVDMPRGWDGYRAEPIKRENATLALMIMWHLINSGWKSRIDVVPGTSGDLQIEIPIGSEPLEIEVSDVGINIFVYRHGDRDELMSRLVAEVIPKLIEIETNEDN